MRCGAVELKLTLTPKLLEKPFLQAVAEPFLAAFAKRTHHVIAAADLDGALLDGARLSRGDLSRATRALLGFKQRARVELIAPGVEGPAAAPLAPQQQLAASLAPPLPPPPPLSAEPVRSAAALRRAAADAPLRARLAALDEHELLELFPRHALAPPPRATDREALLDALAAAPRVALTIEIVSDVVCPWCYLGKRKLELAMARLPLVDFYVRWAPYELAPSSGRGRVVPKREAYLKFMGNVHRVHQYFMRLQAEGAAVGVRFDFDGHTSATFDAHRLAAWALATHGADAQDALVAEQFRQYLEMGQPPNAIGSQVAAAAAAGLDADAARRVLEERRAYADETAAELTRARTRGVSSVPCFRIDDREIAAGAQTPEWWEATLSRHLAALRAQ